MPIKILLASRRNSIALLALFVALGGTGYAAVRLPSNSVSAKQIKAASGTGATTAHAFAVRAQG